MREKIIERTEKSKAALENLKIIKTQLLDMKKTAIDSNVYPLSDSALKLSVIVSEIEQLAQSNESRAQGSEFIELVKGKENAVINQVGNKVKEHLQKKNGVSAYLVSKDYNESKRIGTVADMVSFME
jgi:hypothetical protein